jgi:putative methyltransferase (TIGR04325 family)
LGALIRSWARAILPPILVRMLRRGTPPQTSDERIWFTGQYAIWSDALHSASGYAEEIILKRVDAATAKVVAGNAAFERDGVTFETPQPPLQLLAGLLRAAVENDNILRVVDFGGSLGSSFRQCKPFLSSLQILDWRVVEQPAFVERGAQCYQTGELKFFATIESAAQGPRPTVTFASSSLQYVSNPHQVLNELCETGSDFLIIDRTPFTDLDHDRLVVQHVPESIYPATYPCWLLSKSRMLAALDANWETLAIFPALDGVFDVSAIRIEFLGMILRRRIKAPRHAEPK